MAEYVWVNVYPSGKQFSPYPFNGHDSRELADKAGWKERLSCDRYRVEERDGTRVLVYDPEPKYEQRDLEVVCAIRGGATAIYGTVYFTKSAEQAAELVAKHRQQAT